MKLTVGRAVLSGVCPLFRSAPMQPYRDRLPMDVTLIREALVRARSVLNTVAGEGPEDLMHPARSGILAKREAELTAAIAELDRASR